MTLQTRKLTGVPPWPIALLAGAEKTGKTWAAVEACMSPLVSGGLWFPLGENEPDEYKNIPGFDDDRFDLVEHDGSYRALLGAFDDALAEERAKRYDPPKLWVLDSASRLWDLLSAMAQREMYDRIAKKAAAQKRPTPEDVERKPSVDLWNIAADRWDHVMDSLRAHRGPVVITARMELKAVMNEKGEPTKDKEQKILTHKSLPSDVDAIVEMPVLGEAYLTGVRSVKLSGLAPRVRFKDFSVDVLWRRLGLEDGAGERHHTAPDPADKPAQEADDARAELRTLCDEKGWDAREVAGLYADRADGAVLKDATNAKAIRTFTAELAKDGLPGKEKAA